LANLLDPERFVESQDGEDTSVDLTIAIAVKRDDASGTFKGGAADGVQQMGHLFQKQSRWNELERSVGMV
jgi:hypothetical protein